MARLNPCPSFINTARKLVALQTAPINRNNLILFARAPSKTTTNYILKKHVDPLFGELCSKMRSSSLGRVVAIVQLPPRQKHRSLGSFVPKGWEQVGPQTFDSMTRPVTESIVPESIGFGIHLSVAGWRVDGAKINPRGNCRWNLEFWHIVFVIAPELPAVRGI